MIIGLLFAALAEIPLGVGPSMFEPYEKAIDRAAGTFACLDGSGTIALS